MVLKIKKKKAGRLRRTKKEKKDQRKERKKSKNKSERNAERTGQGLTYDFLIFVAIYRNLSPTLYAKCKVHVGRELLAAMQARALVARLYASGLGTRSRSFNLQIRLVLGWAWACL